MKAAQAVGELHFAERKHFDLRTVTPQHVREHVADGSQIGVQISTTIEDDNFASGHRMSSCRHNTTRLS
jgi:hypothetical protein